MSEKRTFRTIPRPADVADQDIARVAADLAVPTMVKPAASPVLSAAPAGPAAVHELNLQRTAPSLRDFVKINGSIPRYVKLQLAQLAAVRDTDEYILILQGLRLLGLNIDDADLIPRREKRGKKKPE